MKFKNFYRVLSVFAILGVIGNSQSYATTDEEILVSNSITSIDNVAPTFDENTENLYYIHSDGVILDSKYNRVESLPRTLTAIDSAGAYSGIGVYMGLDEEGNIVLVDTIANSPAEQIIVPNDILIGVNGEDIRGQDIELVASKIRGQSDTDVQLTLIRDGVEIPITINRQVITLYEEQQEYTAEPNIDIDSIDTQTNGIIEITYTATDEAGNSAEFVIKVVVEIDDTVLYIDTKETDEEEKAITDTTSGNPPENYELPEVIEEENKVEIEEVEIENETVAEVVEDEDVVVDETAEIEIENALQDDTDGINNEVLEETVDSEIVIEEEIIVEPEVEPEVESEVEVESEAEVEIE